MQSARNKYFLVSSSGSYLEDESANGNDSNEDKLKHPRGFWKIGKERDSSSDEEPGSEKRCYKHFNGTVQNEAYDQNDACHNKREHELAKGKLGRFNEEEAIVAKPVYAV